MGKPKWIKKHTCLFIRQINKFLVLAQLLYTRPTLDISHFGLLRGKKSHFSKPSFTVKGFSTLSAIRIATQSEPERGIINTDKMNNFYEWFSGFTDAEGVFYIAISYSCAFRFQINLHKEDIDALYYIHKTFGEVRSYNNYSSYTVTRLKDIAQLLEIFYHYPLQGSKWLNTVYFFNKANHYRNPIKDCSNCKAQFIVLMNNEHCLFIRGDLVAYITIIVHISVILYKD